MREGLVRGRATVRRWSAVGVVVLVAAVLPLSPALAGSEEGDEVTRFQTVQDDDGAVDGLDGSQGVAVSPDGKHVYATGSFDDAVVTLTRAADGTLAFADVIYDGDPGGVDGLERARGVAVSPDGKHVYVAALADASVATFSRSAATGLLTFVEVDKDGGSGGTELNGAHDVIVSPDGGHVYVVARSADAITVFSRSAATGALTFVEFEKNLTGGVTGMDAPEGVAVSPDGEFVYVAAEGSDSVAVFDRDTGTGALTFVESKTNGGGISGLIGANTVSISPDGKHLYVAGEFDDGSIDDDDLGAVFSRNAVTGKLTFVEDISPFLDTSGDFDCLGVSGGGGVAVSNSGSRVYVTESWHSALLVFARNATSGALTFLEAHCEFLSGAGNINQLAVSPDDLDMYAVGLDGAVTAFTFQCNGVLATMVGTSAAETLVGTGGPDVIKALEGDDTVLGQGNGDVLCGDDGNDTILGGGGNDVIIGGPGNDDVFGNGGIDTVDFSTAPGPVTVNLGTRSTFGAHGADEMRTIQNVVGSAFGDRLLGNTAANRIEGGPGDDTMQGKGGNDVLLGQAGNDIMNGRAGNDTINGGGGIDQANYNWSGVGVTVDLAISGGQVTGDGTDTLISVENLFGSQHDDTLRGNANDNQFKGANGDDSLFGRAGNDLLIGNRGNDSANGGPGTDTCRTEIRIACE